MAKKLVVTATGDTYVDMAPEEEAELESVRAAIAAERVTGTPNVAIPALSEFKDALDQSTDFTPEQKVLLAAGFDGLISALGGQ